MATVAPSPFYTEPSRWFMEQLLDLAPGTKNGGIYAAKPGYHNTRNQNSPANYSVVLPPDKKGPGTKAAGYDWTFPEAQQGNYDRISLYSGRLWLAARANDPRTDGWREFYGQADKDLEVEGYDFYYNRPATSDSSHLWHIHLSELREFLEDLNNKKAMLSILKGESLEDWLGGDVTAKETWEYVYENLPDFPNPSRFNMAQITQGTNKAAHDAVNLLKGTVIPALGRIEELLIDAGIDPAGVRAVVREELDKTKLGT